MLDCVKISSTFCWGNSHLKMMLLIFGVMICSSLVSAEDNECPETERYTVNVTQFAFRKLKIRNYKWCVSIPPRCSYYTEEQRYVPEVVEKEEVRVTNKCCPGFIRDERTQACISNCSSCENGRCDSNNECVCQPGFWGTSCEKACNDSRWGSNCKHECSCTKGDCNPITGYCNCPPGWKGSRCQEAIDNKDILHTTLTPLIDQTTSTNVETLINQLTKYTDRAYYPTFQKYYTFLTTTLKPSTNVESATNATNSDGYFFTSVTTGTSTDFATSNQAELEKAEVVITDQTPLIQSTTEQPESRTNATGDQVVSATHFTNVVTKEKVMDTIGVSVTGTQTVSSNSTWFNHQSPIDLEINLTTHQNEMHFNNTHLIFSIGAIAGILATIILIVAVTVLTTQNFVRKKEASNSMVAVARSAEKDNDGGISSVSIYTRSVFHAPLPEVPAFENSVFATPSENNCANGGTVKTKVVCSMQHHTTESRIVDEFYDHPPSTGSYRAASIPEPPDKHLSDTITKEHLYDEIPCWKQALPVTESPDSYYANTLPKKN